MLGDFREISVLIVFFLVYTVYNVRIIIIIIIITIIIPWEFLTLVSADSLSLEFDWLQVSSSLQDSSQCSGCSQ